MEFALILLILVLLFFNQEMFSKTSLHTIEYKHEPFYVDYIKGSFDPEIDNHYEYDRSGLKGVMYNIDPVKSVEKIKPVTGDHFDCIVKKLELYNHDYYDKI
jgi:hypothetical protein